MTHLTNNQHAWQLAALHMGTYTTHRDILSIDIHWYIINEASTYEEGEENVVEEYAKYIKANSIRELVTVHVVNCLTKQYGNNFPVALNTGTRPTICRLLKRYLGDELYQNLCVSVSSDVGAALREEVDDVVVPPLTRADSAASTSCVL